MPKPKKRIVIFAIFFILLIVAPVGLNRYYNFLLSPVIKNSQQTSQIFVIKPGEAIVVIAQDLKRENLIKNAFAFRLLVAQMGISKNIQAGDFRLSAAMSSRQIAQELTHGVIDVWITLPEGLRREEQAAKIEEKLKYDANELYQFDKSEFIKIAKEGYMFPDTYLVPKDSTAKQVAEKLTNTFDQKVNEEVLASSSREDLTSEEIVILASLVEREAKGDEEKPTVAGILSNRLKQGMALQVDATIQYAKGYDSTSKTWWSQITTEDYQSVKSPFNTYLNVGLPPTPIASAGLTSMVAAASPAETPYLYYLHDVQGKIHYAKTAQEHDKNIQEFLLN